VRAAQPGRPGRPVWLFSSGPLGSEAEDAKGRDLRSATEPREIPDFTKAIYPAAIMSSSGRWSPRAYHGRAVGQETAGRRRGAPRRRLPRLGRDPGLGGRHRPRPERSLTGPVPYLGSLRETLVAIARKALPIRPPAASGAGRTGLA
jgi:hypothetical protein